MKALINKKENRDRFSSQLTMHETSSGKTFFCGHIGPSMNPTLTAQDLLEIRPYTQERPKVGDIVFFQPPQNDQFVVHRITAVRLNRIHTKGDNNGHIDPWILKAGDISGQVVAAQRGEVRRKITGGFIGRLTGLTCLIRRKSSHLFVKLFRPVYWSFSSGGFLHWLIPVRFKPQVAAFRSDANESYKILLGSRIIGSYDESLLQWQIRRPYRLFVDESTLPKPR